MFNEIKIIGNSLCANILILIKLNLVDHTILLYISV